MLTKSGLQGKILVCVLAVSLGLAPRLLGQGASATVLGTVTDASGATIPGAALRATNAGTGAVLSTSSDEGGRFRLPDMAVGTYDIQASKDGFSTVARNGVTLTVGGQIVVDFTLAVGQQQQTVTVEGQTTQVETTNATVGSLTDQRQMRDLPLNGRNFEQLILLAPGVATLTAFTQAAYQGKAPEYSIAGSRPEGQAILLDDENLQNFWNKGIGSVTGTSLGVEAIAEFQTLTNTYSSQFGGNGGVVNAVSKSGTNAFHGSAYDFLRNSAMDSRAFIDPGSGPPAFRKNQYGGSVGGPVKKNKLFIFENYEAIQQRQGETQIATVPACNVGNTCVPTFPRSANPAAYDAIVNTLAIFPLPDPGTVSGGIGRATQVANQTAHEDYLLARFDYNLSDKSSLMGRYVYDTVSLIEPFGGGGFGGGQIPLWPEHDITGSTFSTLEWRQIISPTTVNLARASFSRPSEIGSTATSVEVNGTHPLQFYPGGGRQDGAFAIAGFSGLGGSGTTPYNLAPNRFTYADDMILTRGAHSLRFGVPFTRLRYNEYTPYQSPGSWSFTLPGFLGGGVTPGTGVLVLVFKPLVLPDGTIQYGNRDFREVDVMPYFQDDWKVSRKLTVNLGLRWEWASNAIEVHNQLYTITDFRTSTGWTHVSNVMSHNPNWKNFAPRIGFAYDPFADHKTSIRGGFGMFYQLITPKGLQPQLFAGCATGRSVLRALHKSQQCSHLSQHSRNHSRHRETG